CPGPFLYQEIVTGLNRCAAGMLVLPTVLIGPPPDDEKASVGEQVEVVTHLLGTVVTNLTSNPPIGHLQVERQARLVQELRVGRIRPVVNRAEIVPARQTVTGADDIDGQAISLKGGRLPVNDVNDGQTHGGAFVLNSDIV